MEGLETSLLPNFEAGTGAGSGRGRQEEKQLYMGR